MEGGVARERRAAENQALFRSANDRIKQLNEAFEAFSPYGDWTCECMDIQCVEIVKMTLAEYEEVRNAQLSWTPARSAPPARSSPP